jgi:hypothetical protein
MTQKEKFLLISLIIMVVATIALIINWVVFNNADDLPIALQPVATIGVLEMVTSQTAQDLSSTPDPIHVLQIAASQRAAAASSPNPKNLIEMMASQTAAAMATPSATLLPNLKYWSPPARADFSPRFTYDSGQWALTDTSTLANLQISGCTLRQAGGHGLGPDWSTEESFFQIGNISFVTVLAKYEGAPRFITYSAPDGAVFEIASASDFEPCLQAGEIVLNSMFVQ